MSKENYVHIGTSGWSYKHWAGNFYPENLKEKDFLKFYCEYFDTVEINNSFYHLLTDNTVKNWTSEVPENFVFAVKANRYITHMKRLKDPNETLVNFKESIRSFNDKTGPVLFQLPPNFGFNAERLNQFVKSLSKKYKYVFEFRNQSWFNQETYDILGEHNIALCIYNLGNYSSPDIITADFTYIRMHGNEHLGAGNYSKAELDKLFDNIKRYEAENKEVYCYFNNDQNGYAVQNALELKKKPDI